MTLRTKKDGNGYFIGCRSYPDCKKVVWFPNGVIDASVSDEMCEKVKKN